MNQKSLRLLFIISFCLLTAVFADAQVDAGSRNPNSPKEEVPKGIQESLAKQRIEREKKDYADLVERGEEAQKLSEELEKSYSLNNKFSGEDQKKLDRLEKSNQKIRSELGGDDDNNDNPQDNPSSVSNAVQILQSNTAKLAEELKKTTRYSISVMAVESSNVLLKTVRYLRFSKN